MDARSPNCQLALPVLGLALALCPAAASAEEDKRLIVLPLERGEGVPARTFQSVDDAVAAEVAFAAQKRGYELVPLRKVAGLEEQAARCKKAACRAQIASRAGATHVLYGTTSAEGKGYRMGLFLERREGDRVEVVASSSAAGKAFVLTARIQDAASSVLEEASPQEAVARERLASTAVSYERAGRPEDAARTYRRAVNLNPFHPEAARLMIKVVQVWERAERPEQAHQAFDDLMESFGPRSAWGRAGMGSDEVQAEVQRAATAYLLRAGHRAQAPAVALADDPAKEAERKALYAEALKAYERSLALYPESSHAGQAAFYAGEAAYELGRFDLAAKRYRAAQKKASPENRPLAAEGLFFALEGQLKAKGLYDADVSHSVPSRAKELPGLVTEYTAAAEALAETWPERESAAEALLRAAQAELAFGHRAKAKAHLQKAIEIGKGGDVPGQARALLKKI